MEFIQNISNSIREEKVLISIIVISLLLFILLIRSLSHTDIDRSRREKNVV